MTDYHGDELEQAVRDSLRVHAGRAPSGDLLADQIIVAAEQPVSSTPWWRQRGWRTWGLPLIAAGSVGAVIAAITIVATRRPEAAPAPPIAPHPSVVTSTRVVTPTHGTSFASSAASKPANNPAPVSTSTLHNVTVDDVTFVSADDGWALGSADCIRAPGSRCTAMLHTTDGATWHSMSGPIANVPGVRDCADPCVDHIRFATDQVGYAYGESALYLTTDAGRTWHRQSGGALFLETLDGNVIRVLGHGRGCPGPCKVQVQTAPVGSTSWTTRSLGDAPVGSAALAFARGGSNAYLLFEGNWAGGAADARSVLFRSSDDGATWHHLSTSGEPCPQTGGEVDSRAVAATAGRVSVLCQRRDDRTAPFVATSANAGASFRAKPGAIPAARASLLAGDPDGVLLAGGDGLARSVDGGRSWHDVAGISSTISFVGFENNSVGRVLADSGRAIWTTRNGGTSWSEVWFG